jgi:hypothetical protein
VLLQPHVVGAQLAGLAHLAALGQLGGLAAGAALAHHTATLLAQAVASGGAAEQGAQLLLGALAQTTGLHLAQGAGLAAAQRAGSLGLAALAHLGAGALGLHTGLHRHLLGGLGEVLDEVLASVAGSLHGGGDLSSMLLHPLLVGAHLTAASLLGATGLARALATHLARALATHLTGATGLARALATHLTGYTAGTHTDTRTTTSYHFYRFERKKNNFFYLFQINSLLF